MSMENEYPEENTPRTPVSPVEGTRELNDKPNFKKTDEPWKKPTEDAHDGEHAEQPPNRTAQSWRLPERRAR